MVEKEIVGLQGRTEGQPAHTREAKLGAVFTQTTWDEEGNAIRDPDSTTYTAAIETAEEFGNRIDADAWKRGWSCAEKKVVIGDGAEWIWNIAAQHFPLRFRLSFFITPANTCGTWPAKPANQKTSGIGLQSPSAVRGRSRRRWQKYRKRNP